MKIVEILGCYWIFTTANDEVAGPYSCILLAQKAYPKAIWVRESWL